jgi:hypothetical protein
VILRHAQLERLRPHRTWLERDLLRSRRVLLRTRSIPIVEVHGLDRHRQQTTVGDRNADACTASRCQRLQERRWREGVRRASRRRVRRFRDRCYLDAGAGEERFLELRDLAVQEESDVGIGRLGVQGTDGSESAGERGDAA